ncbi:hypothetical protein BKA63DRAFT_380342, partial [Paraphoma chrysanthemicola]
FPLGHFMRDTALLHAYREEAKQLGQSTLNFSEFRLNASDYYNGEYLSQGALNHSGRSCMMSLEQLFQAGLYRLSPEFGDAEGGKKWAKRVRELRHPWSPERNATEEEIELALQVAHSCFAQLEPIDIDSILLSLKNC